MNARMLILLSIATIGVLAATLMLVDRPGDASDTELAGEPLLPGIRDRVNDVAALEIIAPDGEVVASLHRDRERWRVVEKFDYEADFARVHDLLRGLADARKIEARTADPAWYGRLGVGSPGDEEGAGTMLRFPGQEVPGLIVGKPDQAGIGRYVRLENQERSWLTGALPDIPLDVMDWLETAIMDIPATELAAVSVIHPDGQRVELRPGDAEGSTWVLLDAPVEREVKPAWQIRQTANSLSRLNMTDVRPNDAMPDDVVRILFRTRDGLDFTARLFSEADTHWLNFSVAATPEQALDPGEDEAAGDESDVAGEDERTIDAVAVDGRLSPWQFAIDRSRFDQMTRRIEDLLVPLEAD